MLFRPADRCGVVDAGDFVYAAPLPDGPIMILDGVSALIWQAACDPEIPDVVACVVAATGERAANIEAHVGSFLDELVRLGLLVQVGEG